MKTRADIDEMKERRGREVRNHGGYRGFKSKEVPRNKAGKWCGLDMIQKYSTSGEVDWNVSFTC